MKKSPLMTASMVRAGVIGGLVAGVVLELFLLGAAMLTTTASPLVLLTGLLQFNAQWAVGKAAMASPSYAYLGAVVHFVTCIFWALGFVYAARTRPQIVEVPWISGLLYGIIVWLGTQLVLVATGLWTPPAPNEAETELIAYCIFFGLPLAYTVAKLKPQP
jgi:uncharacterized membrane protein YagU involved in acid resistance